MWKSQFLLSLASILLSLWLAITTGFLELNGFRRHTILDDKRLRGSEKEDSLETPSLAVSAALSSDDAAASTPQTNSEPPLLLLHVGPRKTGTTTIQWFAGSHLDQFERDNFYFVGHNPKIDGMRLHLIYKKCAKCSKQAEPECLEQWENFEKVLDHHYKENHNVVVSEELLSSFHDEDDAEVHLWNHLLPLLKRWRVRVVVTHRRYFEWVPSKYYQVNNPRDSENDDMRNKWPDAGGRPIPKFPEYVEKVLKGKTKYPTALKEKWDARFPNQVEVYNMHNGGEFVQSFFCMILPEATKLCEYLTNTYETEVKNSKSSKVLHYDMLAVAAYKKGLVDKSLSRSQVSKAVEAYAREELGSLSLEDFPLDCLTPAQEAKLLEVSLTFESEMVPEFYASPKGEEELRSKFAQAVATNALCSIDVEQVLNQPAWQTFFKGLSPTTVEPSA